MIWVIKGDTRSLDNGSRGALGLRSTQASVMTGELTELGGCFLGWPEGPQARYNIGVNVAPCLM